MTMYVVLLPHTPSFLLEYSTPYGRSKMTSMNRTQLPSYRSGLLEHHATKKLASRLPQQIIIGKKKNSNNKKKLLIESTFKLFINNQEKVMIGSAEDLPRRFDYNSQVFAQVVIMGAITSSLSIQNTLSILCLLW